MESLERCAACGAKTLEGAAFCHRCGAPVGPPEASIAPDAGSGTPPGYGSSAAPGAGTGYGTPEAAENAGGVETEPPAAAADSLRGQAAGAGTTAGTTAGAAAPGASPDAAGDPGMQRALSGGYSIRIGTWMSRGWDTFTRAGGYFVGFAAIWWLIGAVAAPLLFILGPPLLAGFFTVALLARRGEKFLFSDFWLPFNDFVPLLLAWVVSFALMTAGLLTCGIATVYLWVGYQFAYLLILDRGTDFWEALETSRKAANKAWFGLFAFAALLFLINLVAFLLTFSIGILVSLPLTCCALVEAYADIFGVKGRIPGRQTAPNAAPPASA